jgi:hypothetical protein
MDTYLMKYTPAFELSFKNLAKKINAFQTRKTTKTPVSVSHGQADHVKK